MSITVFKNFVDFEDNSFDENAYYSKFMETNVIISAKSSYIEFPENPGSPLTIKYVFKGSENYYLGSRKYKVDAQNFLVLNEFQKYSSRIDSESTESFSVFFKPEYLRASITSLIKPADKLLNDGLNKAPGPGGINFFETLYPANGRILAILHDLKSMIHSGEGSEIRCEEMLYLLIGELLFSNLELHKEAERVKAFKPSTRLEIYRKMRTARDYIESGLNEKVTLSNIAKAVCMCEFHLLREFRKFYGQTPYQMLISKRLEYAKILLEIPGKTISDIAAESGFEYLSSFSESFAKHFMITPSQYRNAQKVNLR